MSIKLAVFVVFSLFSLMVIPAYANVTSVDLEKSFYTDDENIVFSGVIKSAERQSVFVIIRDSDDRYQGMVSAPLSNTDGTFSTIPREVDGLFKSKDTYYATAFTDDQKEKGGITLELEYDGDKIFLVPDFVLALKSISDKTIKVGKTISFTASITDSSIDNVSFSLDNEPSGATIDSNSGKFVWTPTKAHGNIQDVNYRFDIVVNSGAQEDMETIIITVKQAYVTPEIKSEPKELAIPAPFVDETEDPQSYVDRYNTEASYKKWFDDNFAEYDSIYQAVGLKEQLEIPAPFVDETEDPQSYVDRYNTEASYKKWFDDNFPKYSSIYEAVGLDEPKELAAFVDPNQDPQYYVDRYNKEITYKDWFDKTYPDITIYEAVGLVVEKEEIIEQEFGECGEGTDLVNGMCVIVDSSEGGGCLIATATYGSEMAPQVQFLREIRDNQLMSTNSGSSFMTGFNQLYYLFSPTIADMERENPAFKEAVKIGITPLLSSLSIMSHAESESEILGYGIGVLLLNLGMYVAAPAMLIYKARKYIRI